MHPHADALFFFGNADEQLLAQGRSNGLNLADQRPCGFTQNDFFRPPVFHHRMALHQALGFKTVKQTRQCWPFDANALRLFTLSGRSFKTGQVQQHQPARLRQPQTREAPIQFGTPTARHLGQLHTETVLIG